MSQWQPWRGAASRGGYRSGGGIAMLPTYQAAGYLARGELVAATEKVQGRIQGTPSFEIDGNLLAANSWAEVEPPLRQALQR